MKIVLVNKYLFPKGGDAIITLGTGRLLAAKGHEVYYWGMKHPENPATPYSDLFVDYIDYEQPMSFRGKIKTSMKIIYSIEAKRKFEKFIQQVKPEIIHLHNFAHQISPSILPVAQKAKIPAVMTMHDYKLVCAAYRMLASGAPCEKCQGGRYFWAFLRKCTKRSYLKSMINTIEMYFHHKIWRVYNLIDIFISPSEFMKNKLIEMGFQGEIAFLPNFVESEMIIPQYTYEKKEICYFGRLSEEKGLVTLLKSIRDVDINLKIIGEGPEKARLMEIAKALGMKEKVIFLGYKRGQELMDEVRKSMFVVLPSEWYENNPLSVLEAYALGKPVIGARIGGIPELIDEGQTGYTFLRGSVEDLKEKILLMIKDKEKIEEMGKKARKKVEERYNREKYYSGLMGIYLAAKNKGRK